MDIRPIKTEEDYEWALAEVDALLDVEMDSSESDRFDVLVTLVEAYEDEHYSIPTSTLMEYKNYRGNVGYDLNGKIFTGEIVELNDVITFQGRTPKELETSFHESVDFYLEMCQQDGVIPDKAFSGKFNVRIAPQIHRQIATRAAQDRVSLNRWVSDTLVQTLQRQ